MVVGVVSFDLISVGKKREIIWGRRMSSEREMEGK